MNGISYYITCLCLRLFAQVELLYDRSFFAPVEIDF